MFSTHWLHKMCTVLANHSLHRATNLKLRGGTGRFKFFFAFHRDVPHGHFDDRETWYSLAVTRPVRTEALLKSFGRLQHLYCTRAMLCSETILVSYYDVTHDSQTVIGQ